MRSRFSKLNLVVSGTAAIVLMLAFGVAALLAQESTRQESTTQETAQVSAQESKKAGTDESSSVVWDSRQTLGAPNTNETSDIPAPTIVARLESPVPGEAAAEGIKWAPTPPVPQVRDPMTLRPEPRTARLPAQEPTTPQPNWSIDEPLLMAPSSDALSRGTPSLDSPVFEAPFDELSIENDFDSNRTRQLDLDSSKPVGDRAFEQSRVPARPASARPGSPKTNFGVVKNGVSKTAPANSSSNVGTSGSGSKIGSKKVASKVSKGTLKKNKVKNAETDNKQVGTSDFTLAAQPKKGEQFIHEPRVVDRQATPVAPTLGDFGETPRDPYQVYDSESERQIYEGKWLNANRRPLVELGKPWYQLGQLEPSSTWLGAHNPVNEQFLIYGDYRMGYANAKNANRDYSSQVAFELNLNFDLRLTGTERITAFVAPLDRGENNTRWLFDEDRVVDELDFDVNFGMLEGDLGAIVGGLTGQTLPFDLPFAVGVMPLLVQNGVWLDDAITGVAVTLPARNSARFDISNMDLTFFAGFDEIDSPAFEGEGSTAKLYGFLGFIESFGGYWEIDYAFLEDRDFQRDRSYHNIGLAFTRRYGRFISNSTRVIINAGQSTEFGPNTADGVLLLSENSLITSRPSSFVPYLNFWAGFDRPQSAARAAQSGGVLRNTGILFETDGLTNFPTLDASANDTAGGSIGLNILTPNFDQQLILEFSFLKTLGDDATRIAPGDQTGLGARYQLPISNSWILRSDVMYGFFENTADVHGARLELRHKF